MRERVWLTEIDFTLADASEVTVRLATAALRPFPAADPDRPEAVYDPVLVQPANLELSVSRDLRGGLGDLSAGRIEFANDGSYNFLKGAAPKAVRTYVGWTDATTFAEFEQVFDGIGNFARVLTLSSRPARVTVDVYDARLLLRDNVQETTYAGTNSGATGYQGTPNDLKGKPVPLALGDLSKANVPAPMVNRSTLTHQLGEGPLHSEVAVYNRGQNASLTDKGDSTGATFDAVTVSATEYATDLARGYLRRPSFSGALATFDLKGLVDGDGVLMDTVPVLVKYLLQRRGVSGAKIGPTFDALVAPQKVGLWTGSTPTSYQSVITSLARSIGAWVLPDALGVWQIGLIEAPTGNPITVLDDDEIVSLETEVGVPLEPVYRVVGKYAQNYQVLEGSDVAPAIEGTDRAAYVAERWRTAEWLAPAGFKDTYRDAVEVELETALVEEADCQALVDRWGSLFVPGRDAVRVVTPMQSLPLWSEVRVSYSQQSFDKVMRVVRVRPSQPKLHLMTVTLWG